MFNRGERYWPGIAISMFLVSQLFLMLNRRRPRGGLRVSGWTPSPEMKDFATLQIQCNDSHRTFMWKYLTNLNVTWRAIIFVGVLFCVCCFSYFKAISHVVLISSAFAFCVQIVYWSSCFYWLHTRSKWQQENFFFLLWEQCCLVGLSLSLFIMLVTCFLLPVRLKNKINRVGLMIANCN